MRLLRRLAVVLLVDAALAMPLRAADDACSKEVIIYLDLSGSMKRKTKGVQTRRLFAGALTRLLSRENFAEPGDRILVAAFAERVALLEDTDMPAKAAARIRTLGENGLTLTDEVGDSELTNIEAVLDDIQRLADPAKPQLFIIASDFAHDPHETECRDWPRDVIRLRETADAIQDALPGNQRRKVALLTAAVEDGRCGDLDQDISDSVIEILVDLDARLVPITPLHNQIANLLRAAVADDLILEPGPPPDSANTLVVRVRNPNPFAVLVTKLSVAADGEKASEFPQALTVGCQSEQSIAVPTPDMMLQADELTVTVSAELRSPAPLTIPSRTLTITPPEVHLFEYFGQYTVAVEFVVAPTGSRDVSVILHGIPGATPQIYKVNADQATRVALSAVSDRSDRAGISVAVTHGRLFLKEGGLTKPAETVAARTPEFKLGDALPKLLHWLGLAAIGLVALTLIGFIPGKALRWYHWFHHGLDLFEFIDAVGLKSTAFGGFCSATMVLFPIARVISSATIQLIVLSIAAGGAVVFVLRWLAVLTLWRRVFERTLANRQAAIRRRVFLTFLIAAFGIAAAMAVAWTLSLTLGDSKILFAEPAA